MTSAGYHPETRFAQALPRIGVDDFAVSQTRPHSALRTGDWTLVHCFETDRDELYQPMRDPSQQNDVAAAFPEKTRELRQQLDQHLRAVHARLPTPAPPPLKLGNPETLSSPRAQRRGNPSASSPRASHPPTFPSTPNPCAPHSSFLSFRSSSPAPSPSQ